MWVSRFFEQSVEKRKLANLSVKEMYVYVGPKEGMQVLPYIYYNLHLYKKKASIEISSTNIFFFSIT